MHPFAIERALAIAHENVSIGGRPFGSVIVRGDAIVAEATNRVHISHDPSDHAEMACIRAVSHDLARSDLFDCDLYAIAFPCLMCYACVKLANLRNVYYAVTLSIKEKALGRIVSGSDSPVESFYASSEKTAGDKFVHVIDYENRGYNILAGWSGGGSSGTKV